MVLLSSLRANFHVSESDLHRPADYHGFKNLLDKTPKSIKKFVLVSSVGVESYNSFPYK